MNDREFIGYCETHCRSDLALFAREQVVRIYQLAGQRVVGDNLPGWITVRPAIMLPLTTAAWTRLRPRSTPPSP